VVGAIAWQPRPSSLMAMLDIGRNEDCGVEDGNYEMVAAAPALIGTAAGPAAMPNVVSSACRNLRRTCARPHHPQALSLWPSSPSGSGVHPSTAPSALLLPDRLNKRLLPQFAGLLALAQPCLLPERGVAGALALDRRGHLHPPPGHRLRPLPRNRTLHGAVLSCAIMVGQRGHPHLEALQDGQ